jgi:hypothetical protein
VSNAVISPSGGSVVLRGIEIDLASDIGQGFVLDCARYCEGLVTENELKSKYALTDNAWTRLADNEPLQHAVQRQKERRIRTGNAAREKAQHLFLAAPDVLGGILNNTMTPARSRIEAAKELRQVALGGPEATPATSEQFIIRIDLSAAPDGGEVIEKVVEINKPLAIEPGHNKEAEGDESVR